MSEVNMVLVTNYYKMIAVREKTALKWCQREKERQTPCQNKSKVYLPMNFTGKEPKKSLLNPRKIKSFFFVHFCN
jgi:hypothetical protein